MAYRNTLTDKQWEKWARENPYFGVLLVETNDIEDDAQRENFFASGEQHIAGVLADGESLYGPIRRESAVDFGCGVGRLLVPLIGQFNNVCGIDVSPTMLDLSRRNTSEYGEVELVQTPTELVAQGRLFDFVHSYIVLQHIRPKQGMPLIKQLIALTKPGGVCALHFTIGDPRLLRRWLNSVRYRFKPVHWLYNIARRRPWNESITEMHRYDPGSIMREAARVTGGMMAVRYVDQNDRNSVILYGKRSLPSSHRETEIV